MAANGNVAFAGCGKMGGALIRAALSVLPPGAITVADKNPDKTGSLRKEGVNVASGICDAIKGAQTVFLAVKPQDLDAVLEAARDSGCRGKLFVSIAAGRTVASIRSILGDEPAVMRVMPNLPSLVGKGVSVFMTDGNPAPEALSAAMEILGAAGKTVRTDDENLFDAVTALSGSGPAFFAFFMQAMADAGCKLGLPPELAQTLAAETMRGTAEYLGVTGESPSSFIRAVSSPGGTTEAGMKVLSNAGIDAVARETLDAAAVRSKELSTKTPTRP